MDHHWILGVLVKEMEGHLKFLENSAIVFFEVVLDIGLHSVVLFAALPEK